MTFASPAINISRRSVAGEEHEWVKMFDPPTENPNTPEPLDPTNPVPEVMAAAGFQFNPSKPHTVQRDLLHNLPIPTWNSLKNLNFFVFRDKDNPSLSGNFPAGTIRVPRGVIFHSETEGHGPPPHTIHWHGIEPTPINDGVGHCSMEIGRYIYQWQPNFIGTYFYHCHRNTVQHFEYGLYGLLIIETPDTYFASIASTNPDGSVNLNSIPIGAGRDGKRRTAANTSDFPQFPGFNSNPIDSPDPLGQYPADPHAMTIPYDVEAFWVFDDRDSTWSDLAPDARTTFPKHGDHPGVDDKFHENLGINGFFAFNDFHPDNFFVTGVPVPADVGGTGTIPSSGVIPPALNSGVSGTQVPINAKVDQTILIRVLDAGYAKTRITFPMNVVIIAYDGRALGISPFTKYNKAFLLPANTPTELSTARRFDALIRETNPINGKAKVEFLNTRGNDLVMTALIPINISEIPQQNLSISGIVSFNTKPLQGVNMALSGASSSTTTTNQKGSYIFKGLNNGGYTITPSLTGYTFTPASMNVNINGANVKGKNFKAKKIV